MFLYIGIVIVLGTVAGGYLMAGGNLHVLWQPSEFIIIFGAALGALLISSPKEVFTTVVKDGLGIFKDAEHGKEGYTHLLLLLYQLFWKARKDGALAIEADVDAPEKSPIFKSFPHIVSNEETCAFISDNFRMIVSSNLAGHELDELVETDMEARSHESMLASLSIAKIADSLPGLGIVAAVLGVVLTMGQIDQPPSVLGHHIGAALVGTFVGVLACYGFVSPFANNLEHKAKEKDTYYNVIRVGLVSYSGGNPPQIAVEAARRAIPTASRPSFSELEKAIKGWKGKT